MNKCIRVVINKNQSVYFCDKTPLQEEENENERNAL